MWKAFGIGLCIGIIVAGFGAWAILQGNYSAEIARITDNLRASEAGNRELKDINTWLTEENLRLGSTVSSLREEIQREATEHRAELERIKRAIGEIGGNLERAGSSIQSVIDGLGEIIALVESL